MSEFVSLFNGLWNDVSTRRDVSLFIGLNGLCNDVSTRRDVNLFNRLNGLWNDVSIRRDVSLFICLMTVEWPVERRQYTWRCQLVQ